MTDLDQRLRTEVLLLVGIAERQESSAWFEGALAAAAETGLLPAARVAWLTGLERAFGEPEPAPPLTPGRRAAFERLLENLDPELAYDARLVGARLGLVEEGAYEQDDEVERLVGFKGVAPGPPECDGKRVISVECYDGGLLLRYEVAHEVPDELRDQPEGAVHEHFLDLELEDHAEIDDDVGTEYRPEGGGGSSGAENGRWVSSSSFKFRTPVPPAARRLTVHVSGTRFELDVTGIAERPET